MERKTHPADSPASQAQVQLASGTADSTLEDTEMLQFARFFALDRADRFDRPKNGPVNP